MSTRVPGHTLRNEGSPFLFAVGGQLVRDGHLGGTGGEGRGLCSCGAYSEVYASAGQRKRWHRQHKAEIQSFRPERGDS